MISQRQGERPARAYSSSLLPARKRPRFEIALALSLGFHALILSLRFGAPGFGLPGFAWPWGERRVQVLSVRLAEVQLPPAPAPAPPATVTFKPPEPGRPSRAGKSFEVTPSRPERAIPRRETTEPAPAAERRARERKIRTKPQPKILAQSKPQQETFKVPQPGPVEAEQLRAPEIAARRQAEEPPPATQEEEDRMRKGEARQQEEARAQADEAARLKAEAAARQRAEEETRQREDEGARQRALALQKELEAKEEARRLEDEKKQEEARRQALELEARKRAEESERQKAEELARQRALAQQKEQEAKSLEAARRIEEARKQEEAGKQEEARRMVVEAEALRRAEEAARQQAAAAAAAGGKPADAPGALSGREIAAKAIEQLRAPGAARTEPPRPPSQPESAAGLRRGSVLSSERDVTLRMYADSWRLKLERAALTNFPSWAHRKARDYPVVTVAIRSDGSLEDVIINRTSGVRELDEAVRRMVRLFAPYSTFPPSLARQYDVIEIRRVWYFDGPLRILDEL